MARLQKRNLGSPDGALVSATTNSLLFGSGLHSVSRGSHSLKGIEQPVELFALEA